MNANLLPVGSQANAITFSVIQSITCHMSENEIRAVPEKKVCVCVCVLGGGGGGGWSLMALVFTPTTH